MIEKRLWTCLISTVTINIVLFIFCGYQALAYRPFVSTDADVAEKREIEIELGLFGISQDTVTEEIIIPSLIINYGINEKWEVVGEFDVQVYTETENRNFELKSPALFLKGILREGILQNMEGLSLAVEFGVLIPSTLKGERNAGVEGIGILSGKISKLVYHFNFGGELDRENFDPYGIWGCILEYPVEDKYRLVGEINGGFARHGFPENSGLIGIVREVKDNDLDFGFRKGFSNDAANWEITTGITFSF